MARVLALLLWIALPLLAGLFGSQFRPGEWYAQLEKPAWTPPPWVFGPAWTALYLLMGVAAFGVWDRRRGAARLALGLFVVQLLFNAAWSWIFFGLREPGWAFAEILILLALIVATTLAFFRERRAAGLLLVPYIAWVSYASALNFAIWRMNA